MMLKKCTTIEHWPSVNTPRVAPSVFIVYEPQLIINNHRYTTTGNGQFTCKLFHLNTTVKKKHFIQTSAMFELEGCSYPKGTWCLNVHNCSSLLEHLVPFCDNVGYDITFSSNTDNLMMNSTSIIVFLLMSDTLYLEWILILDNSSIDEP